MQGSEIENNNQEYSNSSNELEFEKMYKSKQIDNKKDMNKRYRSRELKIENVCGPKELKTTVSGGLAIKKSDTAV